MPDIVVLHSGGMDSSVALLMALRRAPAVLSLGIDYGQAQSVELAFAARLCARLGVPRRLLEVKWDLPSLGVPRNREISEMSSSPSPAFVPARNAVFLTLAVAEAAGVGAREVWLGVNALDYSGYPDCRPEFIAAFEAMLAQAMPDPPAIIAPLLQMSKPAIAQEARALGLGRHETWSCYDPQYQSGSVSPCGVCDACVLHAHAWGSPDSSARSV